MPIFGRWLSPGSRVIVIVLALLLVSVGGAAATIYYTYRMQNLFEEVSVRTKSDLDAVHQLKTALLNQKGFATYYFLDGDPQWLEQLEFHRRAFEKWLGVAREQSESDEELFLLDGIESNYRLYRDLKQEVIGYYKNGDTTKGAQLHWQVRTRFFELYSLCEDLREQTMRRIDHIQQEARAQALFFSALTVAGMMAALVLGVTLILVLFTSILGPIRRLAVEAAGQTAMSSGGDGVWALKNQVRSLIKDIDRTKVELEHNQERMLQSEKMAVMGKLAADVAHSIRNPMTAIKMRLFSLMRDLDLTPIQTEDFEVISEEMHHLDNIVSNFLEFSRSPKLRKQKVDMRELLDMTLRLLQHRLELHEVEVVRHRNGPLHAIDADPELLKEALVNFVVNACEAMGKGGRLAVTDEGIVAEGIGAAVCVRFSDTGPGIPKSLGNNVFEPFFSTKEDGTGLGLAIAKKIIEEHGGQLTIGDSEEGGATFVIVLPYQEEDGTCNPS